MRTICTYLSGNWAVILLWILKLPTNWAKYISLGQVSQWHRTRRHVIREAALVSWQACGRTWLGRLKNLFAPPCTCLKKLFAPPSTCFKKWFAPPSLESTFSRHLPFRDIWIFATFARDDYGNQLKISSPPLKLHQKSLRPPLNLAQKMVRPPPHHVPRACQVTSAASLR